MNLIIVLTCLFIVPFGKPLPADFTAQPVQIKDNIKKIIPKNIKNLLLGSNSKTNAPINIFNPTNIQKFFVLPESFSLKRKPVTKVILIVIAIIIKSLFNLCVLSFSASLNQTVALPGVSVSNTHLPVSPPAFISKLSRL